MATLSKVGLESRSITGAHAKYKNTNVLPKYAQVCVSYLICMCFDAWLHASVYMCII